MMFVCPYEAHGAVTRFGGNIYTGHCIVSFLLGGGGVLGHSRLLLVAGVQRLIGLLTVAGVQGLSGLLAVAAGTAENKIKLT